jgi:hypothetical protein
VEWFDPQLAARWANLMVDRANDDLRSRKLRQLESSLEFLQAELGKAQVGRLHPDFQELSHQPRGQPDVEAGACPDNKASIGDQRFPRRLFSRRHYYMYIHIM